MTLETLSPSRAGDFKICPQLFRFRAIDHLPEPTTPQQARGTTSHLALQRFYELERADRSPDRLYDLFRQAWGEIRNEEEFTDLFASPDEERQWGIDSLELLANYFQLEDPNSFDPLERELDLLEPIGEGMMIRGILDRVDRRTDGRIVITDYKTGTAPPETYSIPAFFALKIYALLIRRHLGETPVEVRLLYLNGPTMYRFPVDDRQLDAMERQLNALWSAINRAIERDHFPPRTGPLCNWCSFRPQCPAWQNLEALTG
ncbi:MAG: RecB family exonuclease [Acidimicrobiia bacterium]